MHSMSLKVWPQAEHEGKNSSIRSAWPYQATPHARPAGGAARATSATPKVTAARAMR